MSEARQYTVKKYSVSYVREPEHGAIKERRKILRKDDVGEFCKKYFADMPIENCIVIALDKANKIIGFTVFEGVHNQVAVYPSAVFRFLLSAGAASFVMSHNHPGGSPSPSEHDWKLTKTLKTAGDLLDVCLLDHVIIADDEAISMKASGRWY